MHFDLQLRHMEDWVDGSSCRKLQFVCDLPNMFHNTKRAKKLEKQVSGSILMLGRLEHRAGA
jgi:hypothetical protein